MSETSPIPKDLTGRQRAPFESIAGFLDVLAAKGDSQDERALNGLLQSRTLRLLRQGSREEIDEEALHLSQFLDSEHGKALRRKRPELYGSWCALDDLLAEAGRRRDAPAVDSILQSYGGKARKLLDFLAERGAGREAEGNQRVALPRSEVKKHLELSESHLSHLLRDLEEADLVVRYRVPKGREVMVELGPLGRRVVVTRVFPSWVTYLVDLISQPDETPDPESIEQELLERGAPSEAVARELAEALAHRLSAGESDPSPVVAEDPFGLTGEFRQRLDLLRDPRPVSPVDLWFPSAA